MSNPIKRIGVLTSGGDSPGMNAAVRAVVRTAVSNGIQCIGIRRGWQGLINSDFVQLDAASVGHIISRGGTMLFTARSEDFMTEKGRARAVSTCRMLGLDGIVAIGGDGTFRGALALSRLGIPVVGIPATIDNDIGCTNYTIGFDTACNTAIDCIDKLRDTMQSHERCSVVEVMGRNAGFLALYVGIAVGATAVLVPERELDFQRDVIERIRSARLAGSTHFMIVVAEGVGSAVEIGKQIHEAIGIEPRVTVLGHIQRGGAPNARDRETATRMGYFAVMSFVEGRGNCIIGTREGEMVEIPIEEALQMKKHLQMDRYKVLETVSVTTPYIHPSPAGN
ncbi:MAG: 6-phosphofructokinase [Clostridia bacterium]|nr:6-phosphofructokinase [Clostridia bacterium]